MNNAISREEFNAHMGVVQQGLAETSNEIRELAKSVNSFVQASTRTEERTNHLSHEVSEVKDDVSKIREDEIKPIKQDIQHLKTKASNNALRWWFLGTVVMVVISLSTWTYQTFKEPQADVKAAIENQTKVNAEILEHLKGDAND